MRRYLFAVLFAVCSIHAHALESLRVGSQLLVVGDSAARVKELMGSPSVHAKGSGSGKSSSRKRSSKTSSRSKGKKASAGDQGVKWQYRRNGHTTIFTIVDGKIAHIEDLPH